MTSRERCEALMEYIAEANQGYFDKERIGNDLTAILIDIGRLENINKVLDNIASKIGLEEKDIYKLEEIIEKDLEMLDILKQWFLGKITDYREYDNTFFIDTFIRKEESIFKILGEWLER